MLLWHYPRQKKYGVETGWCDYVFEKDYKLKIN
jgi:hypothetical protein